MSKEYLCEVKAIQYQNLGEFLYMSLITMGWGHATVITMGLGQGFRIHSQISRPFQYGIVRVVNDTPEVEEIEEEIGIKVKDINTDINVSPESVEVKYD